MATEIIKNQTPEERELEKKQAELASLEAELIQRELDLATLRAELAEFESRYLRTVGVLYAELDEIEAQIAEAQARRKPSDSEAQERALLRSGSGQRILRNGQRHSRSETQAHRELKKTLSGGRKANPPRFGHKRR
jgi:hypothetical protein